MCVLGLKLGHLSGVAKVPQTGCETVPEISDGNFYRILHACSEGKLSPLRIDNVCIDNIVMLPSQGTEMTRLSCRHTLEDRQRLEVD